MNAFLNMLYETLQNVPSEIFNKVKEIPLLYELNFIETYIWHVLRQFPNPYKEAFNHCMQLRRKCKMEAIISLVKAEWLELLHFPFL